MEIPVEIGISPTLHIRGVLADRDIAEDELIHTAPIVLIPVEEQPALEQTALKVYYFEWDDTHHCFALGYGSLFNHSYTANVYFIRDFDEKVILFYAGKNIRKGEELTINYNGVSDDDTPIDPAFLS